MSKIGNVGQAFGRLPQCLAVTGVPACGTFSITSAGADVWGAADQLTFAGRAWTGDGVFIARVASLQNTNAWTKAGVMLRESSAAGSKHAFLLVSPGKGIAFQRRHATDGLSFNTSGPMSLAPMWLKLERRGTTINAFTSTNGTAWKPAGSDSIAFAATVNVGLAVSSHDAAATADATFTDVSLTPLLPDAWTSVDIGGAREGAVDFAANKFTIDASGADIWGTSDQFRFTYQMASGDTDVVARVASVAGAQAWVKAGVMIRESLTAAAAHASLFVSKSKGVVFQRRVQKGVESVSTAGPANAAPGWVKLERRGDVITALWSVDSVSWTVIGSEVVVLPPTFYVGLAVTSHDSGTLARGVFDNVSVTPAVHPNVKPTVSLTSPVPNAVVDAPASVTLAADATDSDGTIAGVDFYLGTTLLGSDNTAPYAFTWSAAAAGTFEVSAIARDDQGAASTADVRTFTVQAANTLPVAALTTPVAGSSFLSPATVTVMASASDADGHVVNVDFYADGLLIGSASASPYSTTWNAAAAGAHTVWAEARDDRGGVTSSARVSVTLTTPPPPPAPAKVVFAPSDDDALVSSYRVELYAVGAMPGVAAALATRDLGKPPVVSGECTVDVTDMVASLPNGSYFAVVIAVGSGGETRSASSPTFTR